MDVKRKEEDFHNELDKRMKLEDESKPIKEKISFLEIRLAEKENQVETL